MKTSVWILLFMFAVSSTASANPTFSHTEAGDIRIDEQGPVYNIYSTDRSIGAFHSFGNLAGETINSIQPSADNSAIFRVTGGQPSEFFGALNANSHIFLVNPNGILFGAGSQVNAPGLVASALDLKSANFDAKEFQFERSSTGSGYILNEGTLSSSEGGYVALLGAAVENRGTIQTPGGSTMLASGGAATVSLDNDGAISLAVTKPVEGAVYDLAGNRLKNGLLNSGLISAAGGLVYLSARAMDSVFDQVLNLGGIVEANTVENRNGKIVLDGGHSGIVVVTGTLEARGDQAGENGGEIRVLGEKVAVLEDAKVTASGFSGGFIELSGDELIRRGVLDASAQGGEAGTIFYDPLVIQIKGGAGDGSDPDGTSTVLGTNPVLFGSTPSPFDVYESELEATSANIVLEAGHTITASGAFGGSVLLIQSGFDLTLRTRNNLSDGTGSIDLTGAAFTVQMQGAGDFIVEGSTTGLNPGNVVLGNIVTANGDVNISTLRGSVTLKGDITTSGGDVSISPGLTDAIILAPTAGSLVTIDTSATVVGGDVTLSRAVMAGAAGLDLIIDTSGVSTGDDGGDVILPEFKQNASIFVNDLTVDASGFGAGDIWGDIDLNGKILLGDNGADLANASLTGGLIDMSVLGAVFTPRGSITLSSNEYILLGELNADADADTVRGTLTLTATDVANTGSGIVDGNGNLPNLIGGATTLTTPRSVGSSTDPLEVAVVPSPPNTTGVSGSSHFTGLYVPPPPPPGEGAGLVLTGNKVTGGDNYQQFLTASTTVTNPDTTTDSQTEEQKEQEGDAPAYVTPTAALPPPPLVAPPPTFQQEAPVDAGTFAPCPA